MELNMNTVIDFKMRGTVERLSLGEIYNESIHGSQEDFFGFVQAWITTGRAKVVDTRDEATKIADQIAKELMTVQKGKDIEQDRVDRATHGQNRLGTYPKVGFPARTLFDAQEMHQIIMRNFNIKNEQLGIEMKANRILVTITDCPVKTYASIERMFGIRKASEFVAGTVDKTAKTAVNITDMTINNVAVPVAKTAISTTAKVAKTLFGLGAKLGGITVSELTKATKQCVTEIKSDGYIQEACGEVTSGIHSVKRAIGNTSFGGGSGIIMD